MLNKKAIEATIYQIANKITALDKVNPQQLRLTRYDDHFSFNHENKTSPYPTTL